MRIVVCSSVGTLASETATGGDVFTARIFYALTSCGGGSSAVRSLLKHVTDTFVQCPTDLPQGTENTVRRSPMLLSDSTAPLRTCRQTAQRKLQGGQRVLDCRTPARPRQLNSLRTTAGVDQITDFGHQLLTQLNKDRENSSNRASILALPECPCPAICSWQVSHEKPVGGNPVVDRYRALHRLLVPAVICDGDFS